MKNIRHRLASCLMIASVAIGINLGGAYAISVDSISPKSAGDTVNVAEYNSILGTLRGWYRLATNNWGWGTPATAGVTLSLGQGLQLGAGSAEGCNENFAGFMFYGQQGGTTGFWFCNGSDWRQLDKDCACENSANYYVYKCEPKYIKGVKTDGAWSAVLENGSPKECDINHLSGGLEKYFDNSYYNKDKKVCHNDNLENMSESDWQDDGCKADGGHDTSCKTEVIDGQVTSAEVNNYETRCKGDSIYKYDMCGNKGFLPEKTCTDGCSNQATNKALHSYTDPDTGNTNQHPDYLSRDPNKRFVASCGEDGGLCGTAADMTKYSHKNPTENLCVSGAKHTRIALTFSKDSQSGFGGSRQDPAPNEDLVWQWGCEDTTTGAREICETNYANWVIDYDKWEACISTSSIR